MRPPSVSHGVRATQAAPPIAADDALPLADVVAQVRRGHPDALSILYVAYAGGLLRLTGRILGSRFDAEDVVHDLFVGLPERLAHYDERGSFGPWLRTLAVRLAHMHLRRDTRRHQVMGAGADVDERPDSSPESGTAIDLEREVARLPERLRCVFVLKQWEGYSHDEIAAMLDITSGASRVRHLRALRLLRTRLDP